ncbi:MAG: hypothetical protein ACM3MM_06325 [Acidobacteriota bacterium]
MSSRGERAEVEAGYEPDRIHLLSQHARRALDALDALRSNDPVAADAMRAVRLTRRNLEDLWMPALRDIERSEAMVSWQASRLAASPVLGALDDSRPDHLHPGRHGTDPIRRRHELIAELDWLERRLRQRGGAPAVSDADRIDALADRLAYWVARDDVLAERVVELSVTNMLVGHLLAVAAFPPSFAADVVRRMATPNGPDSGIDPDRYAASLSAALSGVADDPSTCLDLLLDRPTAYALASWTALDATPLSDVVISGLYDAVVADPSRLEDGYHVLRFLTTAANGPLDGGMSAGVALGVASSLAGYVETLAPAIRQEGTTPVVIRAIDPPLEMGTYDDLVDLIGAVLRSPEAQAALGAVLAAYTFACVDRAGGEVATRPDLSNVARFADLLGDAARAERAELLTAAAAEEAQRRRLGGLLGFGADVMLLAGGAPSVVRAIAGRSVALAADGYVRAAPEQPASAQIAAHTYDLVTVAVVTAMATDASMRGPAGLADVSEADWVEARRRITSIGAETDPRARSLAVGALDFWIETSVPALARHLVEIRKLPGMDELTEGRNAVGAD